MVDKAQPPDFDSWREAKNQNPSSGASLTLSRLRPLLGHFARFRTADKLLARIIDKTRTRGSKSSPENAKALLNRSTRLVHVRPLLDGACWVLLNIILNCGRCYGRC